MKNTILALALATVSAGFTATQATAARVAFQADVTITSGDLLGQSFSAYMLADTQSLTGIGDEFIPVDRLNFAFGGTTYTETDGIAELVYFDSEFLGLSFSVDAPDTFSFIPGFFDIGEAFFAYEGLVSDGDGDLSYSTAPVPVPASILFLFTGLAGLFLSRRQV